MKRNQLLSGMLAMVLVLVFSLTGCATMIRTNEANIVAQSGATSRIRVMEEGRVIFEGPLPATVPLSYGGSGFQTTNNRTYTVEYTAGGQTRTVEIEQKFNMWFIGSCLLAFLPIVVDLYTGSMYTYAETTTLPISYTDSSVIFFGENIPEYDGLRVIGNINDSEPTETLNKEFSILFAMN